ncbi:FERM domain-containing protein 6-like [Archocentrus centrarchus]|uniref:FERM domain-containing protein 6-like n=1 Tax=Archocentrus centrarchus TaxID=63155 RepID=UPI0011EA4562|nr:FERM domain-containing protein 6-like [Archocentrus centrarchus]
MRTKQSRHVCVLLPNKQHLDCAVTVKARGHEVLNSVLKHLGVSDLQVFGLAVLKDNDYLFLDLEEKLSQYFGKRWKRGSLMVPFILFLRVQYYVESGLLILSSKVQQLYYTELRQKVLHSQSHHQEALFFQLAASALQADIGDLAQREGSEEDGEEKKQERKYRCYFLPEDYFPTWLIKRRGRDYLLQHCPVLHGELRGVSRKQAILHFIKEANRLQDGPVTFYRMREEKKQLRSLILLGVTVKGVHIYQEVEGTQSLLYDFSWTGIDRFTFQGSTFEITVVGSLCLPKLVYYTKSAFHSKHILRHLSDSHQLHMNIRDAVSYIQQLESMEVKEAYICDTACLRKSLQCSNLTSSMSDSSDALETATAWFKEEREEDEGSTSESELWLYESEEVLVDDPAEVSWLAELLHGVSVDGPLVSPSFYWSAVTMEMKQVLWRKADEGVSVD